MAGERDIRSDLELLRQILPDPYELPSKLEEFFHTPLACTLIAEGVQLARRILAYLENSPEPGLTRVAIVLLSRLPANEFYPQLLSIMEKVDRGNIQAFEPGIWLIQLSEMQIAQDLVRLVAASDNPNPLLLLQRPAAQVVRSELISFVVQHRMPLSLFALYCLAYALQPGDVPLLTLVADWQDVSEMSALAGIYLLRLGSANGLRGIRLGLMAEEEQLRTTICYELSKSLQRTAFDEAGFDPRLSGTTQEAAVEALINSLRQALRLDAPQDSTSKSNP